MWNLHSGEKRVITNEHRVFSERQKGASCVHWTAFSSKQLLILPKGVALNPRPPPLGNRLCHMLGLRTYWTAVFQFSYGTRNETSRDGETVQPSRSRVAGPKFDSQHLDSDSQLSVTLVWRGGGRTVPPDLCGHQACTWYTHVHAGKTLTCKTKWINLIRKQQESHISSLQNLVSGFSSVSHCPDIRNPSTHTKNEAGAIGDKDGPVP